MNNRVGSTIRRELSRNGIRIASGCQKSEMLDYMDRIGVKGCEERKDQLVDSILDDIKNWRRRDNTKVSTPPKETMEDFLRWAIKEATN